MVERLSKNFGKRSTVAVLIRRWGLQKVTLSCFGFDLFTAMLEIEELGLNGVLFVAWLPNQGKSM